MDEMGGVSTVAAAIEADPAQHLPHQRVTQRRNLALLVAALLCERDVNLMALGSALPMAPSIPCALDYELRWEIGAMVSDLKSRGFDLESSQLCRAERIERLLLGLAIAIYWAVSTGMWGRQTQALTAERKPPDQRPAWCARSGLSLFTAACAA